MAESSRRHDHSGVITAFENLQVGAAGGRRLDANADLTGL
jgi:hypothetical protein